MTTGLDPARARFRLVAWMAAGVAACSLIVVAWLVLRSTSDDAAAPDGGARSSNLRAANRASTPAPRGSSGPRANPAPPSVDDPIDDAPTTSIDVPIPARLGGGKPVSPSTSDLADRLALAATELAELADPPGGEVPEPIVRRLEDAHARGTALADRLGLDPSDRALLAGRFTNQLVRAERQLLLSPPTTTREDVWAMVTRDTLEDLRRNLGDDVAQAAEPDVRALTPLR